MYPTITPFSSTDRNGIPPLKCIEFLHILFLWYGYHMVTNVWLQQIHYQRPFMLICFLLLQEILWFHLWWILFLIMAQILSVSLLRKISIDKWIQRWVSLNKYGLLGWFLLIRFNLMPWTSYFAIKDMDFHNNICKTLIGCCKFWLILKSLKNY